MIICSTGSHYWIIVSSSAVDGYWILLVTWYNDEELISLPLLAIEQLLLSKKLLLQSEDEVFNFALKWARAKYPKLQERCDILCSKHIPLIRFPYMTTHMLKEILKCEDLEYGLISKVVLDAFLFKAEAPKKQQALMAERTYKFHHVKVLDWETPHNECIVLFDLRREECASLFPKGSIYSDWFHLRAHKFYLSAECKDQGNSSEFFGLHLGFEGIESVKVKFKFAGQLASRYLSYPDLSFTHTFTKKELYGWSNVFSISWSEFMKDNGPYFIDGVVHLRFEVAIIQ
ncbi:BTB/POZ domain-containing protein POB1 isoform X2 [Amborella trichopoda]|uniref:BTB/POZ domain-containing protein POB1 isoform X2 n=1 Tax=Amborella trichopoda TaxID=13333 RepID=UPI0009BCF162|nr:BTB/POZ domain-containing protein POB1 isoform X2 [Amborella trichopoda]XP_020517846.1 BTB/POZ domain-containing protein POB1 isoform X2 [Amborella trichopoda]|eukprot:XP_020517845.1 BTB/POZ domain-containing protein POB1 isoform X2 [Amborella trichopoda]